jgi:uncharacterized protein involved in exopolysaccharide biosynthesis
MSVQSDGIPLLNYGAMVWRRRWMVLIIAAAMVIPAYVGSAVQARQYQAVAQILLTSEKVDENFNINSPALTDPQVSSLIAILTSSDIESAARAQNGTAQVSAIGKANTNLVTITALDTSPERAAATIDAYITAFSDYLTRSKRDTLDAAANQQKSLIAGAAAKLASAGVADQTQQREQLTSLQEQLGRIEAQRNLVTSGVIVVRKPIAADDPVSPTPVRNALLALVLALILGISLAILLETLRRRSPVATPQHATPPPTATPASSGNGHRRGPSPPNQSMTERMPPVGHLGAAPDIGRTRANRGHRSGEPGPN